MINHTVCETVIKSAIETQSLRDYLMSVGMVFGYIMLAFGFACGIVFGIGVYRIYLRKRG